MEINATLIGQLLTFAVLVWFTLKYVWPPITSAMHEREKKIAAGLEAAERAQRELLMAEHKVLDMLNAAKQQAAQIVEQANHRAVQIIEEGRESAAQESRLILKQAEDQIAGEVVKTREALRLQLADLAIAGAGKILKKQLDATAHKDLLDEFVTEI